MDIARGSATLFEKPETEGLPGFVFPARGKSLGQEGGRTYGSPPRGKDSNDTPYNREID